MALYYFRVAMDRRRRGYTSSGVSEMKFTLLKYLFVFVCLVTKDSNLPISREKKNNINHTKCQVGTHLKTKIYSRNPWTIMKSFCKLKLIDFIRSKHYL